MQAIERMFKTMFLSKCVNFVPENQICDGLISGLIFAFRHLLANL